MGTYINPGNRGFIEINNADYVDKTGLIRLINQTIGTTRKLSCISRPRRFGKSFAVKMLAAYYDASCDSHALFDDKKIAKARDYEKHLNAYNVVCLDITGFISLAQRQNKSLREVPNMIEEALRGELCSLDPSLQAYPRLTDCMIHYAERPNGKLFMFLIDEWDAIIRVARDDQTAQMLYLDFLRELFKNSNFTPRAVAAAYVTGILPIKKDGSQSAISDFEEYTVIKPRQFGEFVGFTEQEVKQLCEQKQLDFHVMKQWYDGYQFAGVGSVYNPNSVIKALQYHDYDSYWTETSAAEGLLEYISSDYSGLSRTIAELIGGIDVPVNTVGFANDLTTFRGKDDVLTLLIHLGYLAYDSSKKTVRIPNEEIRQEFQKSIREVPHEETRKRLAASEQLFFDTIHGYEDLVAAQIERVHMEETSPLHYNREDSLRTVIKLAYYTYKDHYIQFEELPAGEGYADIVYLPRRDSGWPALLIELKWNESAEGAIAQIKERNYPSVLKGIGCPVLLVGISYNKRVNTKKTHFCKIEEMHTDS